MKKRPLLLPILGALLLIASLAMLIGMQVQESVGAERCREVASKLMLRLPERSQGIPEDQSGQSMPILQIDGTDYVALLEIPTMEVTLPIADVWNKDWLYIAPARYCGSVYDHSMVIGGEDSAHQLAFCQRIDTDVPVVLTDMTGAQFIYVVKQVDRTDQITTEWLTEADCDLTIYCHDTYALEYIAVRLAYAYAVSEA